MTAPVFVARPKYAAMQPLMSLRHRLLALAYYRISGCMLLQI